MTNDKLPKTVRMKTSLWIDRYEWKRFVKNCRSIKSSSCHFLEPIIKSINDSIEQLDNRPILPTSNITINMDLNVQRVVRRRKKLGEPEDKVVWYGDVTTCSECGELPFYIGGHRIDPFTQVKKYLCVNCFRFCRSNNELEYYTRIKQSPFYFEGKESRVTTLVSKGVGLRVDVKDFEDWIGIRVS